jgi:hypothetical protein
MLAIAGSLVAVVAVIAVALALAVHPLSHAPSPTAGVVKAKPAMDAENRVEDATALVSAAASRTGVAVAPAVVAAVPDPRYPAAVRSRFKQRRAYGGRTESTGTWTITSTKVTDVGDAGEAAEGAIRTGYTVEGTAVSASGAPFKQGRFKATLSAFSPGRDLPGQRKGLWYVRGSFTITDVRAKGKAATNRHSPSVLRGTLDAQAPFDPTRARGVFASDIRLPVWLAGDRWLTGVGTSTTDEKLAGSLFVTYETWTAGQP